jgi:Kef-type K+ transport system membrane component KefB
VLSYAVLLGAFTIAVTAILRAGPVSPTTVELPTAGPTHLADALHTPLSQLLIQIVVVLGLAQGVGRLFRRIKQPAVVGEMFVGIALGPSVLGTLSPEVSQFLFPRASLGGLFLLSQVGILLFMFVVGIDLDTRLLRQRAHAVVLISHASILAPFLLGAGAALWLFVPYAPPGASFQAFALFLGISVSITALPVLARILNERHLTLTALGTTAITCAAVNDATAWCALAFITAIARAQSRVGAVFTLGLTIVFVAGVMVVGRPLLRWLGVESRELDHRTLLIALLTAFICALCTEGIGIHALFGAFLAGLAMPRSDVLKGFLRERIESFSSLFLVPLFFAFTGLRTQVGLLAGWADWGACLALLTIAIVGKLGGSAIAAKAAGFGWSDSAALGILMNTRGMVELVALNLGLDLGVLSPKLFAMLVLMALVTTFATGPALTALRVGVPISVENLAVDTVRATQA